MKITRTKSVDAASTSSGGGGGGGGGGSSGTVGGDLSGSSTSPQVVGIRGNPVAADTPATNEALVWDGSQWTAAPVAGGVTGFATPGIVLGSAAAAGAATTVIRSDSTIAAFDATVPTTQAIGDTPATGSAAKAARRDHLHGMPTAADIAAVMGPQHAHVQNATFSGDGATTVFYLPAGAVDGYSVSVFVAGLRSQDWTLTGGIFDTLTFGAAPAAGTDNIAVDIVAAI